MQRPASHLEIVADEASLARRLAAFVAETATNAIAAHGRFDLALAGGSTPKAAYALLAAAPYAAQIDWSRVRFFFGDERCVPPDDEQSNYKTAKTTLLDALHVRDDAVFRMRGEIEPADAARAYAAILRRELDTGAEGTPAFDLVMLGMGPDGHTASLFPGSDPFADDALLVRAPFVEKFGTHRITLTPRVLNAAHRVVVATAGPTKAAALAAVLDGAPNVTAYPIAAVRPRDGELTWLVDTAAAATHAAADS
jgi:6-phosphogluconolactonase